MTDQLAVYFLGTGAAAPSPTRWLPALALVRDSKIILCDCGEGAQFRLLQTGLSPAKIHTICISHLHGDHIFGLPGFLTSQQLFGRQTPLALYGPPGLADLLNWIAAISKYKLEYPIQVHELNPDETAEFRIDAFRVTAKNLRHSSPCLGYRFEEADKPGKFNVARAEELGIPDGPLRGRLIAGETIFVGDREIIPAEIVGQPTPGRVITYCTDTRPCETAVELARDADLLIHDSTFSDAYAEHAEPTFHSTSREAADVAKQAGARMLALWHLSIRLRGEEEAKLLAQARQVFPDTILPNDLEKLALLRREVA